jgi:hypothetical protein
MGTGMDIIMDIGTLIRMGIRMTANTDTIMYMSIGHLSHERLRYCLTTRTHLVCQVPLDLDLEKMTDSSS